MAMSRRAFVGMVLTLVGALAAPGVRLLRPILPAAVVEALRGTRYPGRVVELDPARVARAGHWAG